MAAALFIVSTPIGHLDDLSVRALEVLKSADVIACEDTRVTRKLTARYQIETPLVSYHAHSDARTLATLAARWDRDEAIALVSDAGTPLVSDPGAELVNAAIARDVPVVPIPGPSAILTALVASGLPPQPFTFFGFLPRKKSAVVAALKPFAHLRSTLVLYEAPGRVISTLSVLEECLGDRPACVGRELTKRFETFVRGSLGDLRRDLPTPVKGEVVIVVGPGAPAPPPSETDVEQEARRLLELEISTSEAAKLLAEFGHLPKREAYALLLRLDGE